MLDERLPTAPLQAFARAQFDHVFYSSNSTADYTTYELALDGVMQEGESISNGAHQMPCGPVSDIEVDIDIATAFKHCKVAVVTAIFGRKDVLHPPAATAFPDKVCYAAFLDDASIAQHEEQGFQVGATCEGWQVIRVRRPLLGSFRMDSRLYKILLPRILPPSVRWSIWLDSKHRLDYDPVKSLYLLLWRYQASWTTPVHGTRLSIYEELDTVVALKMVSKEAAAQQRERYIAKGFIHNATSGLIDGAMHIRDHTSFVTHLLSCSWWNELVKFPPRDQTSFNYVTFRLGFQSKLMPQQLFAVRNASHGLLLNMMYDMDSPRFNGSTIHVAARCNFFGMMPRMGHGSTPQMTASVQAAQAVLETASKIIRSDNQYSRRSGNAMRGAVSFQV